MLQELKPGLTGTAETVVRETNTALAMGSGSLHVFCHPQHDCADGTGCLQRRCRLP